MKKVFICALAAVAMLCVTACLKDDSTGTGAEARFSVRIPDKVQTKLLSMAEETDIVYYEVWDSEFERKLYPKAGEGLASAAVENREAEITLTLVSGQVYNFIFWAQSSKHDAYDVSDLKSVKVDYSKFKGNSDLFDAFYAVVSAEVKQGQESPHEITLYRPFAQLNFGASEMKTDFGDVVVEASEITVSQLATVFNTVDGVGEAGEDNVVFKADGIASTDQKLKTNGQEYTWIAMDYMLPTGDNVEVTASFDLNMNAPVIHNISNVSLKNNYRTNIVGNLFTTGAVLTIVVEPRYQDADGVPNDDIIKPIDNN